MRVAARTEGLEHFLARCNSELCGDEGPRVLRRTHHALGHEALGDERGHRTSCQPVVNKSVHYLDRFHLRCPPGNVLGSFGLTARGCPTSELRRYTYSCLTLPSPPPEPEQLTSPPDAAAPTAVTQNASMPAAPPSPLTTPPPPSSPPTPTPAPLRLANATATEHFSACAPLQGETIEALGMLRVGCPPQALLQSPL